ncbi:MAG: ROK family protein [Clostridia bacterium]|nr:ROK family protein [Clostridia bacterium]
MYYLGIDLGGMSIKAGLCDEEGNILVQESCPTVRDEDGDRITKDMAALCLRVLEKGGVHPEDLEYAGIASPGTNDSERGVIVYACTLPFLHYPIAEKLSALTGIKKIYIDNDANAAAKGEATFGAAKGYKDSVFLTIGTGVGGGIIVDGKILSGFNFAGAELGHTVIIHNGKPCTCGRKGCLECYASATALMEQTREKMEQRKDSLMWKLCDGKIENVDGRTAFDANRAGDEAAKEVVDTYIGYLACGVTNFINVFQPEVFSIGGGISNEKDALLEPLKKIVEVEQYSRNSDKKTMIKIAELGNRAGIIGAASLGR